ncbi:MAG: MFS transporter [Lachnospiraceae bacterium]|nr:MFS transporter [Lachnospiraceae bacterium]
MKRKQHVFDYKWVIVVLCFLMVFTCLGFCSSNASIYTLAITEALEIKRGVFSIGNSCRYVTTAVVNIFFGALVQKFGTKKLICAGVLSLVGSCFLRVIGTNVIYFYISGCLLGMGLAWTTTTMVGAVIGKWCKENKATIMGAVLASNGLGGALAAQIITPIIYEEGNPFGYRNSYKMVIGILLVLMVLIAIFYKENPSGQNKPVVINKKKPLGRSWSGIEYKSAMRKPYFYCMTACIFITGMVLHSISSVTHLQDLGIDIKFITAMLSLNSLALACSKFLNGFLYDRLGLRITVLICDLSSVLAMIFMFVITNSSTGRILAVAYFIMSAISLPLETVMLPIFVGDFFGEKSFNSILGMIVSINTAGYALGAPLGGWVYDHFGTYRPLFLVCGILMAIVAITFQIIVSVAHKDRQEILEKEAV